MYANDFRLNKNKEEELNCQTYKIKNWTSNNKY
jgi:hypothetical protein